ncbi:MAG: RAMP superfamily CRISPR-associated protein [Thermoproteota archaeon]
MINETPLRIGVGKEPPLGAPVDVAVYRVGDVPCIPGSSIKGVFRAFVESLATSQGTITHSPWDFTVMDREAKEGKFCIICGIFGSTHIASHVRIYDMLPKDDENRIKAKQTLIKTSVGIDREFRGAKPGALFTEELIVPGIEWNFKMDIINIKTFPQPDDERGKLLRSLFDTLIHFGINIGARRSVGYGLIKLKECKWKNYSLEDGSLNLEEEGVLK